MQKTELAIIGAGPAGVSAAIYAFRRGLSIFIFEKGLVGGQIAIAEELENYPGFPRIRGSELAKKFEEHLSSFGIKPIQEEVVEVRRSEDGFVLRTREGREYSARAVILATGAAWRKLGIPGEEQFIGKGVSFCATCDAPFFKKKKVVVIGGGNTALGSALYLADFASKVYLMHRRDSFRGEELAAKRCEKKGVQFILNAVPVEIKGEGNVREIVYEDVNTKERKTLPVEGIFVNIGMAPANELAKGMGIELTPAGDIKVSGKMETSVPGVFAAGDIVGGFKQVVTAVSQGALAATFAYVYIRGLSEKLVV